MPSSSAHHHRSFAPPRRSSQQQSTPAPPPPSSPPASIAVDRLGLSAADVATLRQHQQLAHAQSQSPAGSQASSQGRLLLDPGSLQMLARHFDRVMAAIEARLDQLNQATEAATQTQYDRAGNALEMADAQIARFRAIIRQTEELELELEKIHNISGIVRQFRERVAYLDRRIG